MRISVGPAPSHWGTEKLLDLYRELAQGPVDCVYLGDTACPGPLRLSSDLVGEVCAELTAAGKEVYASSRALVTDRGERRAFDLLAQQAGCIEINSPAFLDLAGSYPAVAGMFLNVYNSAAARILARHGVHRIVLPCEVGLESIPQIVRRCTMGVEVIVHGHIPIAISRTCLTARSVERREGDCGVLCRRYPEGMVLEAGDQPLFRLDGGRTLSAAAYCLVEYLPQMERAGVDTVRILPQLNHTGRIVRIYRDVMDGSRDGRDALKELEGLSSSGVCNGWFLRKAGWTYQSPN